MLYEVWGSLGLCGALWGSLGLSQALWGFLGLFVLYGASRLSRAPWVHWDSLEFSGALWALLGSAMLSRGLCGTLWDSMGLSGILWGPMGSPGLCDALEGALWDSLGFYGTLWNSLGLWDSLGLSGALWGSPALSGRPPNHNPKPSSPVATMLLCAKPERESPIQCPMADHRNRIPTLLASPYSDDEFVRQARTRAKSRAHWRPPKQNPNPSKQFLQRRHVCAPNPNESKIQSPLATTETESRPFQPTPIATTLLCAKP